PEPANPRPASPERQRSRCPLCWARSGEPVYCEGPLTVGGRMFAVIRHYHFDTKDSAEIDRLIQDQFVPIIRKAQGFVRYYWLDTGAGEGASFGVFKDHAGRDHTVAVRHA